MLKKPKKLFTNFLAIIELGMAEEYIWATPLPHSDFVEILASSDFVFVKKAKIKADGSHVAGIIIPGTNSLFRVKMMDQYNDRILNTYLHSLSRKSRMEKPAFKAMLTSNHLAKLNGTKKEVQVVDASSSEESTEDEQDHTKS